MEYSRNYNYEKRKIPFGYIYKNNGLSVSFDEIANSIVNNVIIYDTKNYVLDDFLSSIQPILNNQDKLVIGLIGNNEINKLYSKGIKNGFFRSTNEESRLAIIIVDKKKYYFAFDKNHVYETNDSKTNDIYNYVNHLIWSKSQFEYCQGRLSEVKSTRLSIVKPSFDNPVFDSDIVVATKDLNPSIELKLKEDNSKKDSWILHDCTKSAYVLNDTLYLNAIEDQYYSISDWSSLVKAESFSDTYLDNLFNNQLWIDGKIVNVKKNDVIKREFVKPLDEYKSFAPDFDGIADEYKDYTLSLDVNVTVNPIVLDNSYKLSDSYKKLDDLNKSLDKYLEELDKLIDDKDAKKQLNSIKSERNIFEKAILYNVFIESEDFGVEALNTKTKFNRVTYDLSWVVPSDLLGKLYTKGKDLYFALNDESRIDEANNWLKDNNLKAVLILGKED